MKHPNTGFLFGCDCYSFVHKLTRGAFVRPVIQILGGVGVYVLGVTAVSAGEVPTVGLLYNTKETSSLTYRCEQNQDRSLACEFTQASVRKKAQLEDLHSKIKEARNDFRGGLERVTEKCKTNDEIVEVMEGRKQFPKDKSWNEEWWKASTEMQKKDWLTIFKAMSEFCRSRTEENYVKFLRSGHDKDTRTCRVSVYSFKQNFMFVEDFSSNPTGAWVTQGGPEGPCGVVQLSRFEPERFKDPTSILWKYIARKAITNPKGTLFLTSCKDFDEGEYLYDWRSKEHSPGCDYIEFSP